MNKSIIRQRIQMKAASCRFVNKTRYIENQRRNSTLKILTHLGLMNHPSSPNPYSRSSKNLKIFSWPNALLSCLARNPHMNLTRNANFSSLTRSRATWGSYPSISSRKRSTPVRMPWNRFWSTYNSSSSRMRTKSWISSIHPCFQTHCRSSIFSRTLISADWYESLLLT